MNTEKKNRRNLVLITNEFPFGYGETFLEAEIKNIHPLFDEIVFVPISTPPNNVREIPKQSSILPCIAKSSLKEKLSIPFLLWRHRALFFEMIKSESETIKTVYKATLKGKRRKMVHDSIKGFQYFEFIKRHIEINSHTIFYSYWLSNPSLGLSILKYYYPQAVCIARAHRWDLYFENYKNNYISFQKFKAVHLSRIYFIAAQGRRYFSAKTNTMITSLFLSKLGTREPLCEAKTENRNTEKKVIVSCSNLYEVKRVHLIIEALARVNTPVKWIHIGTGVLEEELKNLALKKISCRDAIEYQFLGQLSNQQVHTFYSKNDIDLFLNVSSSEGLPVSLMEAISYGIPIMATDVGGTSEICNDEVGALLPPNITASTLAEEIDVFFENKPPIDKNTIFRFWKNNFSARINFENFGQSLIELID